MRVRGVKMPSVRKIRQGKSETFYERLALDALGIRKLKEIHIEPAE